MYFQNVTEIILDHGLNKKLRSNKKIRKKKSMDEPEENDLKNDRKRMFEILKMK